jgi:hypothetical protein
VLLSTRHLVTPRFTTRLQRLKATDVWLILALIAAVVMLFTLGVETGRPWP